MGVGGLLDLRQQLAVCIHNAFGVFDSAVQRLYGSQFITPLALYRPKFFTNCVMLGII